MVEFVSANPTGPLHVGHGRQAALGDVIATPAMSSSVPEIKLRIGFRSVVRLAAIPATHTKQKSGD